MLNNVTTDELRRQLKGRGMRLTPQRLAILKVLHDSQKHLTPNEVYGYARELLPGLTEPTVYRTLESLAKQGLALAAHVGNGKLVYEMAGHDHHHLICTNCGKEVEIPHDQLEQLYQHLQEATGYQLTTSHLTFFGLCPACQ